MADPEVSAPADPRDWQPMRPYRGRRRFEITDPVIEPLWSGVRVIALVARPTGSTTTSSSATVALVEELGADLAPELPGVAAAVADGVLAVDAVIDGVITRQVGLPSVGVAPIPEVRGSAAGILMRNDARLDVVARAPLTTGDVDDMAEGFVAFDLLRLDGTSLLDVPLLERKRLLESVVAESELLRRSIHVRPPIETWIGTWKSMGLRGGILKAANSRYRPGTDTVEWRVVESVGRRG